MSRSSGAAVWCAAFFSKERTKMADLTKALKSEKIQGLRLRSPVTVLKNASLESVFKKMSAEKKGYAVVLDQEGGVAGIFTERDVMTRVIEQKLPPSTPVEKVMTPNPKTLKVADSVADAIRLMNEGRHRHVPLIGPDGRLAGVLGVRDLITYLAEHYPHEVYNLPPDPHQILRAPEGA
jgi:CBS domain-containing protein